MNAPVLSSTAVLAADRLDVGYEQRLVIENLSLSLDGGGITALVGPNGSGKSTLLRALARLLQPQHGAVYLDGQAIAQLPTREIARRLAVLPQGPTAPAGLTVAELVEQGRYPHAGPFRMLQRQDHTAIEEALRLTNTAVYAKRQVDSLSGGERQRVWIAMALAQATPILLLDEPTTFLDIGHQLDVLALVQRLNRQQNKTAVLVLHDLNQAARYADRLIALKNGQIVADGTPEAILTTTLVRDVFGVYAHIIADPEHGGPVCIPYASVSS